MLRWTDLSQIPADLGPSVVTLGNFDGVHRGHRAVLRAVREQADTAGALALAVTFDPHPVAVLHPERAPEAITSLEQRLRLLEDTGLDGVLVMEFTKELALWTAEEFVRRVFVDAMHACAVVVGRDTRFGVHNSGDVQTLRELGATHGFEVTTMEDVGADTSDGQGRWSSTRVRSLLAAGDVATAAALLGRPHRVSGAVVHGAHRGRDLGYPTANLCQDSAGLVPADGVYAGWLVRDGRTPDDPDRCLPAAISVGTNPTFDGQARTVEAYVLDRTDLDLYGEVVALEFVSRLRPTEKFDSIEDLLEQMAEDVRRCHEVLGVPLHERS
ncbi:MAG TPA: bifunctional riboflavin kinase/FAD synthetase [Segeticoccus sp.]|uniref:bifunctional riboflavin kinase/FAD synthetase n=1 Tax=Segeticoccus sp. TaxID=2706531 RepID=UPI002D7F5C18|nr:bifunctional riboflavin kinase/FAD synthetase [Segeticoccus sp.]HET8598838.1 bifunctional riboflavin kinase/FAD synthetase [Segeticoccus sp.]